MVIKIYRPPQGDHKAATKLISKALQDAHLKDNVEIFLMGDFNINWKDNKAVAKRELEFLTGSYGLFPLIKNYTRNGVRQGIVSEKCIDLIFSNSTNVADGEVLDLNLSDHLAVSVRRKMARRKFAKVTFTGRSYKNYDKGEFQTKLFDQDWEEYYSTVDPNVAWEMLEERIRTILNKSCP